MNKILHIALREFLSTVVTKGFIIGVLVTPALIAFMAIFMPMLMNEEAPRIEGDVSIIDPITHAYRTPLLNLYNSSL